MKPSFAYILRDRRKALRLTQAQLGAKAGISQRQISYFENEQAYPDSSESQRLARALGCTEADLGISAVHDDMVSLPRGFLKCFGRSPEMHIPSKEVSMSARVHTAITKYPEFKPMAQRLRTSLDFTTLERTADCNSAEEAVRWMMLADRGAKFARISHARLGWHNSPIVDKSGNFCLTGKLWPVLYLDRPQPMVFFPQVRVQTKRGRCRIDMNVALGGGACSEFVAVEVIAGGHIDDEDEARPFKLRMPVIQLVQADLRCTDVAGLILERYRALGRLAG